MFSGALLSLLFILLIIFLGCQWNWKNRPPGPFPWPFVGNLSLLRWLTRKYGGQHLAFLELSRRYNSNVITLRLGTTDVVVVSGLKAVETVLNSEDFDGRPWNEFSKLRNMGMRKGVTINDGPEWKEVRAWVVRNLRTIGFGKRQMVDLIREEVTMVLENLKDGGTKQIKPIITPAVLNVLWSLATGKRFCQVSRLEYFVDLIERRSRAFDMAGGMLSIFPYIRYIMPDTSGYNLLLKLNSELKGFIMEIINDHKRQYTPGNEADLIDMFLREMHGANSKSKVFTDDQLMMILIDLLIAGSSTTATALDFLFLNMIVHREVQQRIQKEIDSVIAPDRLPDLTDRPKLPYTEAVLTECQRAWGILPIIGPRRVLRETTLEGYSIPKNTTVLINTYSVNMDSKLYAEPEAFKPERFLRDGVYQSDIYHMPFGKGRRRCPAETLAKSAIFLIFVGVLHKYSLQPIPGQEPEVVETVPGMMITPKPYEVQLVLRRTQY